jgi:hypothetical protein
MDHADHPDPELLRYCLYFHFVSAEAPVFFIIDSDITLYHDGNGLPIIIIPWVLTCSKPNSCGISQANNERINHQPKCF